MSKSIRFGLLSLVMALLASCGSQEELIDSAKQEAKYHLTHKRCSKALKVLDDVGFQKNDSLYIALYASGHACKAGYSELDLFGDLGSIQSAADQVLGSLASLSSSNETQADSANYKHLMKAIDVLLAAGGGASPSAQKRARVFGSSQATRLNFQALYLILTELGKFMAYYGNTDTNGSKGAGSQSNTCLFSYSVADAMAYVTSSGLTGSCNSATGSEGSAELPGPATSPQTLARLCEGVYLFNNLRDILSNIDVGTSGTFDNLSDISDALEDALDQAEQFYPSIGDVRDITSKTACAQLAAEPLEIWYAVVFETALP